MRWTQGVLLTRARSCGRRSRVVLTPRRWRQVSRSNSARRRWQKSPVTGESAKETVKTIAQGRPGRSGEPVVTTLVYFVFIVREAAGASCARLSLRPLFSEGRRFRQDSRENMRRDREGVSCRHCEERLRRSNPSRGEMDCFAEPVIGHAFARPVGSQMTARARLFEI